MPMERNERKGKRESQRREVVGSLMVEKDVLQKNKNLKPLI